MLFLCHGQGFKVNWELCWWYVIQMTIWQATTNFILCVIHFRKKLLTAIFAFKHAHYTFCIVIQMRIGGFLDIFLIKVGNWNWIIFGLQQLGDWSAIVSICISCGTLLTATENGIANKSNLSVRFFKSQNRDSNSVLVETIIDMYLSRSEGLQRPKSGKWAKLKLIKLSFPKT